MTERLSASARRVLELSATGLSTGEVASALGVPAAIVRDELIRAMVKLGAHSKLEAIVKALREGLIDPPRFT